MNIDSSIWIALLGALSGVGMILQGSKKGNVKSKKVEDDGDPPKNYGKRFMIVTGIVLIIIAFLVIFTELYLV